MRVKAEEVRQKQGRMIAFVLSFAVCVLLPGGVMAQQSTLHQQLLEPDCSQPNACEMATPTITEVNKNGSRPVIQGTYDAVFSKYLRVIFGERMYTLGVDEQITATNGSWVLDLSRLSQPLAAGAYELIVETEGYDGEVKRVNTVTVITLQDDTGVSVVEPAPTDQPVDISEEPLTPSDDSKNIPRPMTPEEARAKVSFTPLVITLLASVILATLGASLSWQKHKN